MGGGGAEPKVAAGQRPRYWFWPLTAGAGVSDWQNRSPLSTLRGCGDRRRPETVARGADPFRAAQPATAPPLSSMNSLRSAAEPRVLPIPLGSIRDPAGQLCNRSARIV